MQVCVRLPRVAYGGCVVCGVVIVWSCSVSIVVVVAAASVVGLGVVGIVCVVAVYCCCVVCDGHAWWGRVGGSVGH